MMNTMYKRLSFIATALMILTLTITGCTSQASNIGLARENDRNTIGTDFVVAEVGSYDSADTAVVVSTDLETGYITFLNIATGRQYTLSYDGTTYVKDRYEGPMAMSQIKEGDIVDITFLKSKKRLTSVQLSPNSWVFSNIGNYDLGGINKTATIGSNTYSLPDEALILSEGRRAELMEIVNNDILTVSGIDHTIYSINVQRGHGYLRLSNEQALVGGWIEVGNTAVQRITEDMLLAVPEGSYQVVLTNDKASCVKEVVIERNKEVILDASDLEILQDKTGKILFSVNPSTATVKVDGEIVDISDEVELTYGIHQVRLEAEGYLTMAKYIQVGSEYASISFTMEEGESEDKEDNSNSVSDNSSVDDIANAVTNNRVYIDAPHDAEVYLDGNYVGVAPVSFTKVTGDHTITLSRTGYISKSYTIYLYDDGQDITYSFADLESEYDYDAVSGTNRVTSRGTSSRSTYSSTDTEEYEVTIRIPQEVEIYLRSEGSDQYEYIGYDDEVSLTLEKGNYTIKLEKDGYLSIIRPITVNRKRTITFPSLTPEKEEENKDDNTEKPSDSNHGNDSDDKSDGNGGGTVTGDGTGTGDGSGTEGGTGTGDGSGTGDGTVTGDGGGTGDGTVTGDGGGTGDGTGAGDGDGDNTNTDSNGGDNSNTDSNGGDSSNTDSNGGDSTNTNSNGENGGETEAGNGNDGTDNETINSIGLLQKMVGKKPVNI